MEFTLNKLSNLAIAIAAFAVLIIILTLIDSATASAQYTMLHNYIAEATGWTLT